MKYRRKSEIIEAVQWDGNIETIENNKWLEEEIKEGRGTIGMNDISDKEPILLIFDDWTRGYVKVKKDDYIVKNTSIQKIRIRIMDADRFKKEFELVEEKQNNCITFNIKLNAEDILKEINKVKEKLDE